MGSKGNADRAGATIGHGLTGRIIRDAPARTVDVRNRDGFAGPISERKLVSKHALRRYLAEVMLGDRKMHARLSEAPPMLQNGRCCCKRQERPKDKYESSPVPGKNTDRINIHWRHLVSAALPPTDYDLPFTCRVGGSDTLQIARKTAPHAGAK